MKTVYTENYSSFCMVPFGKQVLFYFILFYFFACVKKNHLQTSMGKLQATSPWEQFEIFYNLM